MNAASTPLTLYAGEVMRDIAPELCGLYTTVIAFLEEYPHYARHLKVCEGKSLTHMFVAREAEFFAHGRRKTLPAKSPTRNDPLIPLVLEELYHIPTDTLPHSLRVCQHALWADRIIKKLLLHYLASVLEQHGWVWCSGQVVSRINFIRYNPAQIFGWDLLKVRNKDTPDEEAIGPGRAGSLVRYWTRFHPGKGYCAWEHFPDAAIRPYLSEEHFWNFAHSYLHTVSTDAGEGSVSWEFHPSAPAPPMTARGSGALAYPSPEKQPC